MADSASPGVNCFVNNYAALLQGKAELLMFGDCKAWAGSQGSILGVYSSTAGKLLSSTWLQSGYNLWHYGWYPESCKA